MSSIETSSYGRWANSAPADSRICSRRWAGSRRLYFGVFIRKRIVLAIRQELQRAANKPRLTSVAMEWCKRSSRRPLRNPDDDRPMPAGRAAWPPPWITRSPEMALYLKVADHECRRLAFDRAAPCGCWPKPGSGPSARRGSGRRADERAGSRSHLVQLDSAWAIRDVRIEGPGRGDGAKSSNDTVEQLAPGASWRR